MPFRSLVPAAALGAAASLVALSAGPALAAAPVAQAGATGLRVTVGGTPTDSGSYSVTNDGTKETSSGTDNPPISAVDGQPFVQAGTLAQDAATSVKDKRGYSRACAGLAGDGATLAEVSDTGCLTPGQNLTLNAGTLDLTGVQISQEGVLNQLTQPLQDALQPVLDPLFSGLTDALSTVLDSAGLGLYLDLGAVQSQCSAGPGTAAGDAQITDAGVYAELQGQRVDLVALPVDPDPNTHVVTDLGAVVQELLDALSTEFSTAIDGALGPLADVVDQASVLAAALGQVGDQLAPLEENVLDIVLNKQVQPAADEITVTALDLSLLPVATQFGADVLSAQIGESTCGPSGRVGTPSTPTATPTPTDVPTSVPAGLASVPTDDAGDLGSGGTAALLALLALSAGAGVAAYRRSLRS